MVEHRSKPIAAHRRAKGRHHPDESVREQQQALRQRAAEVAAAEPVEAGVSSQRLHWLETATSAAMPAYKADSAATRRALGVAEKRAGTGPRVHEEVRTCGMQRGSVADGHITKTPRNPVLGETSTISPPNKGCGRVVRAPTPACLLAGTADCVQPCDAYMRAPRATTLALTELSPDAVCLAVRLAAQCRRVGGGGPSRPDACARLPHAGCSRLAQGPRQGDGRARAHAPLAPDRRERCVGDCGMVCGRPAHQGVWQAARGRAHPRAGGLRCRACRAAGAPRCAHHAWLQQQRRWRPACEHIDASRRVRPTVVTLGHVGRAAAADSQPAANLPGTGELSCACGLQSGLRPHEDARLLKHGLLGPQLPKQSRLSPRGWGASALGAPLWIGGSARVASGGGTMQQQHLEGGGAERRISNV